MDPTQIEKVVATVEQVVQQRTAPDVPQTMGASATLAAAPNAVPVTQGSGDDVDPTEVKPAWYWIKDSRGYGSIMATLTFVAFWVTTASYILSMFDRIGPFSVRPFDVSACATYFIPIMTAFVGKHVVDAKYGSSSNSTGA